jgi:hypothetical protein
MLSMQDHIDGTFNSPIPGGVKRIKPASGGGYTGPGGTWEAGAPEVITLKRVNIQAADMKTLELLVSMGGTSNPKDVRVVHINDGENYLYPDDDGKFADLLEFSDGLAVRQWRVIDCDNRPWRSFCKAIVERYRGA